MKRFLVGCLAVVALLAVTGGALAYIFVVRPVQQAVGGVQELSRVATLNESVRNRSGFSAPETGELSEAQLKRFVAVQQSVRADLEGRFETLNARYENVKNEGVQGFTQMIRAYGDVARLIVQAKEAQVAALNAQNFSLEEYAWVKGQVLAAAGLPLVSFDLAQVASGQDGGPVSVNTASVPEANRALVEPYRERLEDLLALSYFGL